MSSDFKKHKSSFRDPSGFVFIYQNVLYRQINQSYKDHYSHFISSGLYDKLVADNRLIGHEELQQNLSGDQAWSLTLKPEFIPFISYPYEWCFDMLKDAALTTLEVCLEALSYGMILKDATPYNIQFRKGKPVFIDTLSFEKYNPDMPWIAYRQFSEQFLAPLALSHYFKEPFQKILSNYLEGIPVSMASKLLPIRSKLNLNVFLHLHLQGKLASRGRKPQKNSNSFSEKKLRNILISLKDVITAFQFDSPSGIWSNYYKEANERSATSNDIQPTSTGSYIQIKKEIIEKWIDGHSFQSGIDIGANEGVFTKLLADKGINMIAADSDHYSVNKLYADSKITGLFNILPLFIDFTNPSPGIGVNNTEREPFTERMKADLVVALAVIHHFIIEKNISFQQVFALLKALGQFVIVEYIPLEDEKIRLMLKRKAVIPPYSEEIFVDAYEEHFVLLEKLPIGLSGRILYFLKKR
ncbi:MAG TPA: hypothetical protein VHK91_01485 [Flavisolibacter sp.]|jgi:SAM-dependent methyltransferase|nr:hypothetical protein [Flavisolibacter sp.]